MSKKKISIDHKTILITGSPGFIGAHLSLRLLELMKGGHLISLDNMNAYYDPALKKHRLQFIEEKASISSVKHSFIQGSISDAELVKNVFAEFKPSIVVNLAAQAGVRYSIDHPNDYIESNIIGFFNILEACRYADQLEHLVFASSSSVYGNSKEVPFRTEDKCDSPVSLYAATKKSNELLAHSYSKLYDIPATGLRFFTVYGPAGRPDMFYYSTADKLLRGEKISVFNYGNCMRDFTYIDDIVEGIVRVMQGAPEKTDGGEPPFAVYNIGGGKPENLEEFLKVLEEELVRQEVLPADFDFDQHTEYVGMQPGDVPVTYADTTALEKDYGYKPETDVRTGLKRFVEWYKEYYRDE